MKGCAGVHIVLFFALIPVAARAQAGAAGSPPEIGSAWDQVITTALPQMPADPVLLQPQTGASEGKVNDFLNHFFFESRTDYERFQTSFTSLPTTSGVIDAGNTGIFNPGGIPYPPAFQTGANRIYSFIDLGTRGYLSDRVNTHFAVRYDQDLTHVDIGSSAANVNETLTADRRLEVLNASVEIDSKPTDGIFAGTSIELGRLNVYGAEYASFDGASFTFNRPKYQVTLYGGRRFTFFTDPLQRGIGGANLLVRLNSDTSLTFESLWYIRGSNAVTVRHRFNPRWLVSSYFRTFGGSPVDFEAQAAYASRTGRTTFRAAFFQKLTANDYTYDYTVNATNLNPNNPLLRLYLGPIEPYSQFTLDAHRQLVSNLRVGGSIVVRRLNASSDQGPFDTSFEDYQIRAQYYPFRKIEFEAGYHQRNSDRLSPLGATTFDDVTAAGETSVKDLTGQISRPFREGRFYLSAGMYYRRISLQDRFYYLNNLHQSGVLASAWVKVDPHTRLSLDYSLDNDFFLLEPDLKNSQVFRAGLIWKY